jgi:ADP-ribose pyrophosphatase YjhB (NUDIX family)
VLLIRQKKAGQSYWLVPGGGVNYGENLTETLYREVREELSVGISRLGSLVFCHDAIDPAGSRHLFCLYFEGELDGIPEPGAETNLVETAWFDSTALATLDLRPPVLLQLVDFLAGRKPADPYTGAIWKEV